MLKRGTKFRIKPYGACVVESYDDTSGKYIMRILNSSYVFYASEQKLIAAQEALITEYEDEEVD